jgi:phosphate transport system protein
MQPHTVTSFDAELKAMAGLIGEMVSRAEASVADAAKALDEGNVKLAHQVIEADTALDRLQHKVEEMAFSVIARRQPVSVDLRAIVAAIRIANDLERIGDLAKNVAKRAIAMGQSPAAVKVVSSLLPLALRVKEQVRLVGEAYRTRDSGIALEVWRSDGAIDKMHTSLFRELLTYMMEDPRSIGTCTHLLFCAKNFERIGDHATNIAETTNYMITGQVL